MLTAYLAPKIVEGLVLPVWQYMISGEELEDPAGDGLVWASVKEDG
jgi:hypothetical protein